jgi:dTDP-4-dehydrorhamnose 3,5-epimerase
MTTLPGVEVLARHWFSDQRGTFSEAWKSSDDKMRGAFRQMNIATSHRGVLRGMHRQNQTKLVMPITGKIFDVVLNPETSEWFGVELEFGQSLLVPPQYAHGYLVLTDTAIIQYIVDAPYDPDAEESFKWDSFGIEWPLVIAPILSRKDSCLSAKTREI